MSEPENAIIKPAAPKRNRVPVPRREKLARPTQFPHPRGINSCHLRLSRKGKKLAEAMSAYANSRLLPKLQARTDHHPECNGYVCVDADFRDACVYLLAWLRHQEVRGGAEFPFARLYPVKGGLYNPSVRRLIDWSRVEDNPIWAVQDLFWNQAPNAKFWVKLATHKTFEERMDYWSQTDAPLCRGWALEVGCWQVMIETWQAATFLRDGSS